MNILMANWSWYPSGGDWTYINSICKLYESKGHQIIPFSVNNEKNFPTAYNDYFLKSINYKPFYNKIPINKGLSTAVKIIYSFEARNKIRLLLKENNVDIAQLNNINGHLTPSIIPELRKAKVPIVWRILDYRLICPNSTFLSNDMPCNACYKHKYYNCIIKKCKKSSLLASTILAIESYVYYVAPLYKYINVFSFQSEFTRDLFVKFGYDIKRTCIIENPYDCSSITPDYNGKNYILFFGRISKEKGLLTLLKAMKTIPDLELKVVGDGPEYNTYFTYIKENFITNVKFLGPIWDKQLEPIIKGCEFIIVPSEWNEPSGYVVLQAFSYGKSVIASDIGGLKDIVVNNKNGLFFEPGNIDDLSNKIRYLISNRNLIQELGINGRLTVEEKYNPDKYYSQSMELFSNLIK